MKTKFGIRVFLLVVGIFLFNYLFWQEGYGLNVVIYSLFVIVSIVVTNYWNGQSKLGIIYMLTLIIISLAIVWHSSLFSIVMYYITFILLMGWLHEKQLKTKFYIVASSVISLIKAPVELFSKIPMNQKSKVKFRVVFKVLKLSIIPLIILFAFYLIYINANPVFENYAIHFLNSIGDAIVAFFKAISFQRVLFVIISIVITAWILFITNQSFLFKKESKNTDNLSRKRKVKQLFPNKDHVLKLKEKMPVYYRKKFALSLKLKSEYISAAVLLILVNILLLVVNIIDINWVWFGFEYSEEFDLKQFVHEGTYLLIISILLSITIMLYFFRRNLNFYKRAKLIKRLSYVWIFQNIILAVSVAFRNFHYIEYWGLAYKRIGVIIFLIAVAYGLYSLYIKIRYTKSAFFLIKRNSMAVYLIVVFASLFNWDGVIAKHNLNHPLADHMETSYLLTMSDKVLPLIDKKTQILEQDKSLNTYTDFSPYSYKDYYKLRIELFISNYEKNTWLSWNYADAEAYKYYKNKFDKK